MEKYLLFYAVVYVLTQFYTIGLDPKTIFRITLAYDPPVNETDVCRALNRTLMNLTSPHQPIISGSPNSIITNHTGFCSKTDGSTHRLQYTINLAIKCSRCGCKDLWETLARLQTALTSNVSIQKIFNRSVICGHIKYVGLTSSCTPCPDVSSNNCSAWDSTFGSNNSLPASLSATEGPQSSSSNLGKILGAVFGTLAGLALAGGLLAAFLNHSNKIHDEDEGNGADGQTVPIPFTGLEEAPNSVPPAGTS